MFLATPRNLIVAAALAAPLVALAENPSPEPDYTVAYNIGAVSDYRVRGISQTDFGPAIQGGIDLTLKSGLYLGTFASNVDWVKHFNGATKGSVEIDLYGGFRGPIADIATFDAGVIRYQYPSNNSGEAGTPGAGLFGNASTTEVYLNLGYKIANLKYNRSIGSFLGNLDSSGSQYIDLNCTIDLGKGFSLTPHVGHQWIPHQGASGNAGDYTDYSIAVAKDFGNGLVVTAAALKTTTDKGAGTFYHDLNGRDLGKSTVTIGLKYTF